MKISEQNVTLKNGEIMTIRIAEKADAKKLLDYIKQIGGETDYLSFGFEGIGIDVEKEEEYIGKINASPNNVMLIATIGGKIIADCSLSAEPKSRFSHNVELGIAVEKAHWGLGIASILLEKIIKIAKENKYIEVIHLTYIDGNDRAASLYKKFGFIEIGRHKNFSKVNGRYFDAVLMDLMI